MNRKLSSTLSLNSLIVLFLTIAVQTRGMHPPNGPAVLSNTALFASDVAVEENYAYFAGGEAGFLILDVSDPASPVKTGSYQTTGNAVSVEVAGSYAYVAYEESGLRIVDITDPANPIEAGSFLTPGAAIGVELTGHYAFVSNRDHGLSILDVTDLTNPREAGFFDMPGTPFDMTAIGNYAFVADGGALRIIEISDPANPREAGLLATPSFALGVTVEGEYAYIASGKEGLRIVDISVPIQPREIGFSDTPGDAVGEAISGSIAYIADVGYGLHIVDVSNPASPREVGMYGAWLEGEEAERRAAVNYGQWSFTAAGIIAALFVHVLTWYTRQRYLPVAVWLGGVAAFGLVLISALFIATLFMNPDSGADGAYVIRYFLTLIWAFMLLFAFLIGALQARSFSVPWWEGVLSACFEAGVGFLVLVVSNYTLQKFAVEVERLFIEPVSLFFPRFIWTFTIALVVLAIIRPMVRPNTLPRARTRAGRPS